MPGALIPAAQLALPPNPLCKWCGGRGTISEADLAAWQLKQNRLMA
jgi:hypothetical protein